jgi:tRNA-Thr(GGU) m(6)t(6)A37 methyltransferase TsaA
MLTMAVCSFGISAYCAYQWHNQRVQQITKELQARRQEERTGRIRAEVRLRTLMKEQQQTKQGTSSSQSKSKTNNKNDPHPMSLTCIATVVSPFTKRMGTPRQSQIVPSSRGYLQFTLSHTSLDGILEYSHLWVVFAFHANTNLAGSSRTKIRPPRAGGQTMGQLATRSPHRPNPLGLSLVKIESWNAQTRQLLVSGLDLVHGTPVYDVKPYVPWDSPGYGERLYNMETGKDASSESNANNNEQDDTATNEAAVSKQDDTQASQTNLLLSSYSSSTLSLRVPDWVTQDDRLAAVEFTQEALDALHKLVVINGHLTLWYSQDNDGYQAVIQTLREVLAQDPRSSHKGQSVHARGTTAAETDYHILFGDLRVSFVVQDNFCVLVRRVESMDLDSQARVDGVPLVANIT